MNQAFRNWQKILFYKLLSKMVAVWWLYGASHFVVQYIYLEFFAGLFLSLTPEHSSKIILQNCSQIYFEIGI